MEVGESGAVSKRKSSDDLERGILAAGSEDSGLRGFVEPEDEFETGVDPARETGGKCCFSGELFC